MKTPFSRLKAVLFALVFWSGIGSAPALAQRFDVGGDFLIGLPQNEFRDKVYEEGYGFSGHFGYFLGDLPVMVGADVGFLNYGTEKRREPISLTIPDVTVDVRTTNNIFMFHGFARVQPQRGPVRPYVEGLWGFKYFFTQTAITEHWYEEEIASSTNYDDFAGSWGAGAGVDIRIWEGRRTPPYRGAFDISLNLSARYLWGSEAGYLKKGSILRDPYGGVTYLVSHSSTDMLLPQAGIRIRF